MGDNYLNSGESIILTTHSVGVDGGMFDVLLTTERIVLVDNRYARFEPRTIPFTRMLSVKGGRIPTGEPAITLVLTETGALSDSLDQHLVFTQQPGEDRRHERDLWVRQLIELVVSARQHAGREEAAPASHEPGVTPTVRRWEAPDHLLPRTTPEKEPVPAKLVVEPEGTELPEFLFEEPVPSGMHPDEEPEELQPVGTPDEEEEYQEPEESRDDGPALPGEVPFPVLIRSQLSEEIRLRDAETSVPPESTPSPESQGGIHVAYTGEADESEDILAADNTGIGEPPEHFASTVSAAISAIISAGEVREPAGLPGQPDEEEPADLPETPAAPRELSRTPGPDVADPEPVPVPGIPHGDPGTGGIRNVSSSPVGEPAAAAAFTAAPVPAEGEQVLRQPVPAGDGISGGMKPERKGHVTGPVPPVPPREIAAPERVFPAAALAVLGIIVLVGIVVLVALFLPGNQGNPVAPVGTPALNVSPTSAPVLEETPEAGVRVRVISPGTYVGTIGNPGFLHQVSGSGDTSYTVLKNDDLVSVSLQKQDNSGSALTVEIYNNGSLLTSRTVSAPMGEIQLLIDPKTANPPGITPVTAAPAGAATLTYN
jgi:hypothetical protein